MSTAKIEPPKELFSRQWYDKDGFGMTMLRDNLFHRVDSLLNKLKELRRLRLWEDNSDNAFYVIYKGKHTEDDIRIDVTLETLQHHIGVWHLTYDHTFKGDLGWKPVMSYPNGGRSMGARNIEMVLGKGAKEGRYLVMASPECVHWLNEISKLVGVHV